MPYTSAHYLSQVITHCADSGANKENLISMVPGGSDGLSNPMARHDSQVLIDVYQAAAEELQEPSIGLFAGSKFNTSVLNLSGKILPLCDTFGQSIKMLQRYHRVTQSFGKSILETDDDTASIVWQLSETDYNKYHAATEGFFVGITVGARWLLWNAGEAIKYIQFRHDCPTSPERYSEIVGYPVYFNREYDALVFDKSVLETELPTGNPEALEEMSRNLDRILVQIDEDEAIVERVNASIREQLREGSPELSKTAQDLNVSVANLRYRLKLQNTTFRKLVEATRLDLCERELRRGRKMYLIAQRLGFHDQAAFNRAFKKWYGVPPKQYQLAKLTR